MSGEPKTLTPEEGTLEGLIATLGIHGYSLTFQEGRWWAVPPQDTPYEWCEGDTPGEAASKALGVPVVARDEAAELRAALREWREASRAEAEAHKAWTDAIAAQPPLTEYIQNWGKAKDRKDDAVAALRRLAGEGG